MSLDFDIIDTASGESTGQLTEAELRHMQWAAEMLPSGTSSQGWRGYVLRFAAWLTRTTD